MGRVLKLLHFVGLAMFLGSILVYVVISIVRVSESDPAVVLFDRRVIAAMTWALTFPGMWLVVVTGAIMSVRGGLWPFKVRWVTIKLLLAAVIVFNGSFILVPTVEKLLALAQQGLARGTQSAEFAALGIREDVFGTVNFVLILVALVVAVYRPGTKLEASGSAVTAGERERGVKT